MQSTLNVGADVAKDEIVVACADNSFPPRSILNQRRPIVEWLKSLPKASRLGVESTSRYHELLADLAQAKGLTVFLLNPRDTRHYAKALGQRAKTDRIDAQLIARYVAHEHGYLLPYKPPTKEQRRIDQLLKRRAKLSSARAALRQTFNGIDGFVPELKAVLAKLDKLIKKIDSALTQCCEHCPAQAKTQQLLQTIDGVGPVVSMSLANLMQRLQFKTSDAIVAFTGYDTRVYDSGQKTGRRRLSKRGPSELRRLLFIAAMAAAKTKLWRPVYTHYRDKGLSTTASLCILARKILRIAWSIHKYQLPFDPQRLQSQT